MRRLLIASLSAFALGAGLAAPALSQQPADEAAADEPAGEGRERIRLVGVNGYNVIDNQHLILDGIGSRYYLVTLQRRCFDLRVGAQIATSFGSTATIYNPRFEYIIASRLSGGSIPQRCRIETIEQVESRDAARALVEARREAEEAAEADEVGEMRG